jgi:hypothetical protein
MCLRWTFEAALTAADNVNKGGTAQVNDSLSSLEFKRTTGFFDVFELGLASDAHTDKHTQIHIQNAGNRISKALERVHSARRIRSSLNDRCCRELRVGATQSKLKLELTWERNDGGRLTARREAVSLRRVHYYGYLRHRVFKRVGPA